MEGQKLMAAAVNRLVNLKDEIDDIGANLSDLTPETRKICLRTFSNTLSLTFSLNHPASSPSSSYSYLVVIQRINSLNNQLKDGIVT